MIHWDGADTRMFLDILEHIERGETVEVSMRGEAAKTVSTAEDVRALLPPRNEQTELNREEYEDVLRTFMPSKEMREHLINYVLGRFLILELILGAPVPMSVKAEYCRALSSKDDVLHRVLDGLEDTRLDFAARYDWEWEISHSFAANAKSIESALEELTLKSEEILLLYEAWYDDDYSDENEGRALPFLSAEAALRYIRDEIREEEWNDETACWTRLEKWAPGEDGEMLYRYRYYLIRDEFVFYEKDEPKCKGYPVGLSGLSSYRSADLNLPVPYRPGDIVEVDCLPFAPVKHVLLLEVGSDCCGVSCLFRTEDGKWETGALKHGHFMGSYRPMLSPLYKITAYSGYLPPEEQPLMAVEAYIGGDAEKGRQLWNTINRHSYTLRTNELMKLIGFNKGYDEKEALLTYRTTHLITRGDAAAFGSCSVMDATVAFSHEYDDELVFLLRRAGGRSGTLVIWDKDAGKAISTCRVDGCVDAVRYQGRYYRLAIFTKGEKALCLTVRETSQEQTFSRCIYSEEFDQQVEVREARFESAGNSLFVVLNGKRLADIAPDIEIEA